MRKTFGLAMAVITAALLVVLAGAAPSVPATAASSRPAKELTLDLGDKVTLKLMLIPAGKFMMGSPETEKDRHAAEVQHEVTISKPFYMGITHVTVDQFTAFAKDSEYKTDAEKQGWSISIKTTKDADGNEIYDRILGCSWRNPGFDQKGDHPVVQVSWNDANTFCNWLSTRSGKTVELPTEAQWEYACRAGTKTAYPWGEAPADGKGWANCEDQSCVKTFPNRPEYPFTWDDGFVFTSPVASFKPNAFGLYDMIGNALQWCRDRGGELNKGPVTDPMGPDTGQFRVVRGGGWRGGPRECRSAARGGQWYPSFSDAYISFRVAVGADSH